MRSMIFIQEVKRSIYSNRTVNVKCWLATMLSYLLMNLMAIEMCIFRTYPVCLAIFLECIATIAMLSIAITFLSETIHISFMWYTISTYSCARYFADCYSWNCVTVWCVCFYCMDKAILISSVECPSCCLELHMQWNLCIMNTLEAIHKCPDNQGSW